MARILISELLALLKEHPQYYERWELGVLAEQALYIKFRSERETGLESEVLEIVDGSELVIDRGKDGKVYGIEIT
jgi:hypothetical protein